MKWQTMETAPKDGTRVLVFVPMYSGPNFQENIDYHKASSGVFTAHSSNGEWHVGNTLAYDSSFTVEPIRWSESPEQPDDV
jgi:hypothetical protein